MYLYTYRTGKDERGNILTIQDLENDLNSLLLQFNFKREFAENIKCDDGSQRIDAVYENIEDGIAAFKITMTNGNTYHFTDDKGKNHICSVLIGFLCIPVTPVRLNQRSKRIVDKFYQLILKYHKDLEDVTN
ncbi:MAG: hypothetical protein NTY20_04215 [Candidatus Aenigmarchaeota archaeon]|nr:hypothetical protein [Candidatus Aenigmarchaeota archaeon]